MMRWVGLVLVAVVSVLPALGCPAEGEGDDSSSAPDDPVEYYAPCIDNPHCGMGSGLSSMSSDGTCVCKVFCEEDADCPAPATGMTAPVCVHDDLIINGMSGECSLPCSDTQTCPDELTCDGSVCRFAG